jgi:hypothetical protein
MKKEIIYLNEDLLVVPTTFEAAVDAIQSVRTNLNNTTIAANWLIGKIVNHMQEHEGTYGNRITDRVAAAVSEAGKPIGKRLVEECHRAFKKYPTTEAIQNVIQAGAEWTQLRLLTRIEDNSVRDTALHVVTNPTKPMTTIETNKYIQEVIKDKPVTNPAKPDTAASGFLGAVELTLTDCESKLDKAYTFLRDVKHALDDKSRQMPKHIDALADPSKTPDEVFGVAVKSAKNISATAKNIASWLSVLQSEIPTLLKQIESINNTHYVALKDKVYWDEHEQV